VELALITSDFKANRVHRIPERPGAVDLTFLQQSSQFVSGTSKSENALEKFVYEHAPMDRELRTQGTMTVPGPAARLFAITVTGTTGKRA
jgi:hypothetical protein